MSFLNLYYELSIMNYELEWVSHREVERCVAFPARVEDRPTLLVLSRIVGFHPEVEAKQKVCEVEA